jgi:hypothetical protein
MISPGRPARFRKLGVNPLPELALQNGLVLSQPLDTHAAVDTHGLEK